MSFTILLFYLFSFVLLSSALFVVSTRNMVHGVLFLVLTFVNASALFILLGAEFLALLLIVVYVGAIAVLFLFVVMMLDIDIKIKEEINRKRPILALVGVVMLCEIILINKFSSAKFYQTASLFPTPKELSNTQAIGNILYTDFILPFQLAGGVLFVAMVGAIVLTLRDENKFFRTQNITNQVLRNKANSIELVKVKVGEGLEI
jgi:NADH-quinone oxidoreductase subunit J